MRKIAVASSKQFLSIYGTGLAAIVGEINPKYTYPKNPGVHLGWKSTLLHAFFLKHNAKNDGIRSRGRAKIRFFILIGYLKNVKR